MEEERHITKSDKQEIKKEEVDLSFRNIIACNIEMNEFNEYAYNKNYKMVKLDKLGGILYMGYKADYDSEVEWTEPEIFFSWISDKKDYTFSLDATARLFNADNLIDKICPIDTNVFFYSFSNVAEKQKELNFSGPILDQTDYHELAVQRDFTFSGTASPYKTESVFNFDVMFPVDRKSKNPDKFYTLGIQNKVKDLETIQTNLFYYLDGMFKIYYPTLYTEGSNPFYNFLLGKLGKKAIALEHNFDQDALFKFNDGFYIKSSLVSYYKIDEFDPEKKAATYQTEESKLSRLYEHRKDSIFKCIKILKPVSKYQTMIIEDIIKNDLSGIEMDESQIRLMRVLLYIFFVQNDLINEFFELLDDFTNGKITDDNITLSLIYSPYKKHMEKLSILTRQLAKINTKALLIKKYCQLPFQINKDVSHCLLQVDTKPSYGCIIKYNGRPDTLPNKYYADSANKVMRNAVSINGGQCFAPKSTTKVFIESALNDIEGKSIVFRVKNGIEIVLIRAHRVQYDINPAPVVFDHVFILLENSCIKIPSNPDKRLKSPYYICEYLHGEDKEFTNGTSITSTVRLMFKPEMNIDPSFEFEGDRKTSKVLRSVFDTTFYIRVDHFTYQDINVLNLFKVNRNGEDLFVVHPKNDVNYYYKITVDSVPILKGVGTVKNGEETYVDADMLPKEEIDKVFKFIVNGRIINYDIEEVIKDYKDIHKSKDDKVTKWYDYPRLVEQAQKSANGDDSAFCNNMYNLILNRETNKFSEYGNYDIEADIDTAPFLNETKTEDDKMEMEEVEVNNNCEVFSFGCYDSDEESEEERVKDDKRPKKPLTLKDKKKTKVVLEEDVIDMKKKEDEIKKDELKRDKK